MTKKERSKLVKKSVKDTSHITEEMILVDGGHISECAAELAREI